MSSWDTEFSIEQQHRPCLCGVCHKQIGVNTTRVTCTVTSDYRNSHTYNKFYHLQCMLGEISKALENEGLSKLKKEVNRLRKLKNLIDEI